MADGSSLVSRLAAVSDVRVEKTTKNFEFAMARSDGTTTSQMIRCVAQKACPEVCGEWPVNCGPETSGWPRPVVPAADPSALAGVAGFVVSRSWCATHAMAARLTTAHLLSLSASKYQSSSWTSPSACRRRGLAQNDSR